MKRCIVSLVLALMSVAGYAQNVLGKWVTTDNESNVEIYQNGDKLFGKIIWLKRGEGQLDVHNPDKSLRSRNDRSHQERQQVGRRQDLQPDERQDLQMCRLARRQHPESPRLRRSLLRNPYLDAEVISFFMAYESSSARPKASTCCVKNIFT